MKYAKRKNIKKIICSIVVSFILLYNNFSLIDNNTVSVSNKPVNLNDEIEDDVNAPEVSEESNNPLGQNNTINSGHRVAFLTFDDGPCINNTLKIVDILNKNNIKATFFVVGKKAEQYPDILRKLSYNNMCIAPHTYSHEYKIYQNREAYLDDLKTCTEVIKRITNRDVIKYTRLPGGSFNSVSNKLRMKEIKDSIKEENLKYVDWNVTSGDALKDGVATYKIKQNVIKQCKNKSIAVILFHDAYYKKTTVEALPDIIKNLKEEGFIFKTFNDISPEEEQTLINQRVINR